MRLTDTEKAAARAEALAAPPLSDAIRERLLAIFQWAGPIATTCRPPACAEAEVNDVHASDAA